MNRTLINRAVLVIAFSTAAAAVVAEPIRYDVDPRHTYPAFEADHQGGLSIWRGKVRQSSGVIILDREAKAGSVEMTMQMDTIDFGLDDMNDHARAEDILNVEQFPTATYTGTFSDFKRNGEPTGVDGQLTLHGVTHPVKLDISRFHCQPDLQSGVEVCGADASATINRDDYGVDYGKANGFLMYVNLLLTVEARRADPDT